MDLIDKQVTHKSFGEGSVVEHSDSYIKINFASGDKSFIFPDAFGAYLTLNDKSVNDAVKKMIQKKEKERNEVELELEKEKALERIEQQNLLQRELLLKNLKIHPSSQAAFWCEEQDKDRVFKEWKVFTGVIKSGKNEGQPNRPIRLHQNSACLLTARDPNMSEKDRCIVGVYMVNESFIGKLCEDGYVPAHSIYRLQLSEQESEKMLFWKYYSNEKYPSNMTWNTGKYRYFENVCMAQILRDIISLKTDPLERELVQKFFEYFCVLNKITEKGLPKPNGTLILI